MGRFKHILRRKGEEPATSSAAISDPSEYTLDEMAKPGVVFSTAPVKGVKGGVVENSVEIRDVDDVPDDTKAYVPGLDAGQEHELLGPEPTPEELETLPRVSDYLPFSVFFVTVVELSERFTYYGVSGVFQNYMQLARGNKKQTGGLGLGQSTATALNYFFQFWCYVTPIPGALVADMWLGKYNTIFIFSIIYAIGILVLFVTSLPGSLDAGAGEGGLIAAMIIIGLGTGGIKANVSTLIADQYTNKRQYVRTLPSGARVIVDPATTMQRIFMVFYFCINIGSLSAIATSELEKNVDFWAAFLLPFCFFFLAIITLVLGRNKYIRLPPQGSPIPNAVRIAVLGLRNGLKPASTRYIPPPEPVEAYTPQAHTPPGWYRKLETAVYYPFRPLGRYFSRFTLDIAKPSVRSQLKLSPVPWDDVAVDEVSRALYGCKVFIFYPIYWVVYGQMLNNFVSQAGQMQTHDIPNDLMQNIDPIALIIFIPTMERLIYPMLRKMGFAMKPITRIFWGFVCATLAMAYAAIVQSIIYSSPPCYKFPLECPASNDGEFPNRVHVAVQTPAYAFIAFSEILASITGLEYAYTKAPVSMKSFIMSLFLLTNAFGSALGIALSPTAKNPKLMWMYIGLAIATIIGGFVFWFIFKSYNDKEDSLNQLEETAAHRDEPQLARTTYSDTKPFDDDDYYALHPTQSRLNRIRRKSKGDFSGFSEDVSFDFSEPSTKKRGSSFNEDLA